MKKALRQDIIQKRLAKSQTDILNAQNHIIKQLSESEHFLKAEFIGIFYPTKQEMDLTSLIDKYPNKVFAYPKIVNEKIQFLQSDKNIEMKISSFGVSEPAYEFDITSRLEVVLVPALGMTKDNYR